jgi:quinolinate synthase
MTIGRMVAFAYNLAMDAAPDSLRKRFSRLGLDTLYTEEHCRALEAEIARIHTLKRERAAIVLAHNYQRPEIFEVADFVGDSLELSREAERVDAPVIVFCGVHFMAETAKILNPASRVLLPNLEAGCTLADAADAEAVAERAATLRHEYPDLAVVSYVNTTAAVKAVSDICVTSGNALRIVESLPNSTILFLPDRNLAAYVASQTTKRIIPWDGDCSVHAEIQPIDIFETKKLFPKAEVLVHPECRTDVLNLADAVLSTAGMIAHARNSSAEEFIIVTECGLSDRLLLEIPEKRFYKSCRLCKFMKMITLDDVRGSLERLAPEILLDEAVIEQARHAIVRMLELS